MMTMTMTRMEEEMETAVLMAEMMETTARMEVMVTTAKMTRTRRLRRHRLLRTKNLRSSYTGKKVIIGKKIERKSAGVRDAATRAVPVIKCALLVVIGAVIRLRLILNSSIMARKVPRYKFKWLTVIFCEWRLIPETMKYFWQNVTRESRISALLPSVATF